MADAPLVQKTPVAVVEPETPAEPLVEEELLVEDVSIDGMCGVY
jgi:mycofactocin precursor